MVLQELFGAVLSGGLMPRLASCKAAIEKMISGEKCGDILDIERHLGIS